ncbi:MAG TPA: hypothetical protein ENJ62_00990, partial [Bryobacterales bacterium]|nr:hypothetical protein [Bryobacterales bacterium]
MNDLNRHESGEGAGGALVRRSSEVIEVPAPTAATPSPGTLEVYWGVVQRQKWVLAVSVVVCVAAAVIFSLLQTPRYAARA